MVDNLQRYGVIISRKVAEVMETIDRALFVPSGGGLQPYVDTTMPSSLHRICMPPACSFWRRICNLEWVFLMLAPVWSMNCLL
ncbi:Protein-L-isoaspartate O-methyltransferase [Glycine soja]|uniref:Protein-L-isoaspartate O-methyltransferase n=1 Tax=Glycine soja TaxID=3848 RepID=A0A0B2PSA7_GLYSO|nr:Protein-L-isoaspartate O-methyltransferase [Glycine soja]